MTLDELIRELLELKEQGHGAKPVWVLDTSDTARPELVMSVSLDGDGDVGLFV